MVQNLLWSVQWCLSCFRQPLLSSSERWLQQICCELLHTYPLLLPHLRWRKNNSNKYTHKGGSKVNALRLLEYYFRRWDQYWTAQVEKHNKLFFHPICFDVIFAQDVRSITTNQSSWKEAELKKKTSLSRSWRSALTKRLMWVMYSNVFFSPQREMICCIYAGKFTATWLKLDSPHLCFMSLSWERCGSLNL